MDFSESRSYTQQYYTGERHGLHRKYVHTYIHSRSQNMLAPIVSRGPKSRGAGEQILSDFEGSGEQFFSGGVLPKIENFLNF